MDNIVSARRLRKSYLREIGNIDTDMFEKKHSKNIEDVFDLGNINVEKYNGINTNQDENKKKFRIKFKTKIIVKALICSVILFTYILINLVFSESAKSNKYISAVIYEYNKEGSKTKFLEKMEDISKTVYNNLTYLIPKSVALFVQDKYLSAVKPRILNFNFKEKVKSIFSNNNTQDKQNGNNGELKQEESKINVTPQVEQGVGGGGPIEEKKDDTSQEPKYEESISAISTEQNDVDYFNSKNISFMNPVEGTITSVYGARDEIFDDVDPYHTGVDIANKLNTPIKAATQGTVVNVEQNNKYYGKMIEIEYNSITFKYGHMNEIKVTKGASVTKGQVIGLMGSTGISTGSHLHLEVRINGQSVDPQKLGFYK